MVYQWSHEEQARATHRHLLLLHMLTEVLWGVRAGARVCMCLLLCCLEWRVLSRPRLQDGTRGRLVAQEDAQWHLSISLLTLSQYDSMRTRDCLSVTAYLTAYLPPPISLPICHRLTQVPACRLT